MSILLRSKLNFAKELIFYPAFIRLFTCSYYSADLRDIFQWHFFDKEVTIKVWKLSGSRSSNFLNKFSPVSDRGNSANFDDNLRCRWTCRKFFEVWDISNATYLFCTDLDHHLDPGSFTRIGPNLLISQDQQALARFSFSWVLLFFLCYMPLIGGGINWCFCLMVWYTWV